jgi:hypothetical protein
LVGGKASCVANELGAPLAVVDALADADHAARRDIVGRSGLLHLGAPHTAEHLDRGNGGADGVHGVAVGVGRRRGRGGGGVGRRTAVPGLGSRAGHDLMKRLWRIGSEMPRTDKLGKGRIGVCMCGRVCGRR